MISDRMLKKAGNTNRYLDLKKTTKFNRSINSKHQIHNVEKIDSALDESPCYVIKEAETVEKQIDTENDTPLEIIAEVGVKYCKFCEYVEKENIIGKTLIADIYENDQFAERYTITISESDIVDIGSDGSYRAGLEYLLIIEIKESYSIEGITFTSGTWFMTELGELYKIKYKIDLSTTTEAVVKGIDPIFLPKNGFGYTETKTNEFDSGNITLEEEGSIYYTTLALTTSSLDGDMYITINGQEQQMLYDEEYEEFYIEVTSGNYISCYLDESEWYVFSYYNPGTIKIRYDYPETTVHKIDKKYLSVTEVSTSSSYRTTVEPSNFTKSTYSGSAYFSLTTDDYTKYNDWSFTFTTGSSTTSVSISLSGAPTGTSIKWADGVDLTDLESSTTYVVGVIGSSTTGIFGNISKFV